MLDRRRSGSRYGEEPIRGLKGEHDFESSYRYDQLVEIDIVTIVNLAKFGAKFQTAPKPQACVLILRSRPSDHAAALSSSTGRCAFDSVRITEEGSQTRFSFISGDRDSVPINLCPLHDSDFAETPISQRPLHNTSSRSCERERFGETSPQRPNAMSQWIPAAIQHKLIIQYRISTNPERSLVLDP